MAADISGAVNDVPRYVSPYSSLSEARIKSVRCGKREAFFYLFWSCLERASMVEYFFAIKILATFAPIIAEIVTDNVC